jgi:hypothetical protein
MSSNVDRKARKIRPLRTPRAFKTSDEMEVCYNIYVFLHDQLEQDLCTISLQEYSETMKGTPHRTLLVTTNTLHLSKRKYKKGTQAMPIMTGKFPVIDYCPFELDWERVWGVIEGETAKEFYKVADEVFIYIMF